MRKSHSIRLYAVAAYAALAALPFVQCLGDNVFAQTTALMHFDPWRTSLEPTETDFFVYPFATDVMSAYLPWERHIRRGETGWNPYQTAGAPFMATHFTAVYYPPKLFLAWLGQPETRSVAILAWLHMVIAAWGVFELAKTLGLRPLSAWMAGMWFAGSAFFFIWIGGPLPLLAAWMPWLFLALESLCSVDPQKKERGFAGAFAGLATLTLVIWLAGNSQTGIHVFGAAILYGTVRLWVLRPSKLLLRLFIGAAALGLGTLMATFQLIPTAHAILHSSAWYGRQVSDPLQYLFSWPETKLFLSTILIAPGVIGAPFEPLHGIIQTLYPVTGEHSLAVFHEMAGGYIGPLGAVMAFVSLFLIRDTTARRWCWPWWLLGLVSFGAVYDLPPVINILTALPVIGKLNHHRSSVVLAFAGAMLAAYFVDRLCHGERDHGRHTLRALIYGVCVLVFAGIAASIIVARTAIEVDADMAKRVLSLSVTVLIAYLILLRWLLELPWARKFILPAILVLCFLQLAWVGRWYVQPSPAEWCYPENEVTQWLHENLGENRVLFADDIMPPSLATWYGIREISGYEPTGNRYIDDLLLVYAEKERWLKPYLMNLPYRESRLLDLFAVRYVVERIPPDGADPPLLGTVERLRPRPWVRILERPSVTSRVRCYQDVRTVGTREDILRLYRDPDFFPGESVLIDAEAGTPPERDYVTGSARIQVDGIDRVEVSVSSPGPTVLVLFDSWFPGWRAFVGEDEVPLLRAFGAFRAVDVPAGEHVVRFRFRPAGLGVGRLVSGLGLLLTACVGWWLRRPYTR